MQGGCHYGPFVENTIRQWICLRIESSGARSPSMCEGARALKSRQCSAEGECESFDHR